MAVRWRFLLLGLLVMVSCVYLLPMGRTAAQIIIDPPPQDPLPPLPASIDQVQIALHQVDVTIDGLLTQVKLTQVLRNDSVRAIEGTYVFPLPANAAIGDFQMTVNGEVIEGEILRKEAARRAYEAIVRQQRDPALLEYLGHDLFQVSLFPIPAGETRKLELTYSQVLTAQDGLYQFRYPLQTRQLTAAPVESMVINVDLVNQPGLRTLYSPNHLIETTRHSDSRAHVGYAATNIHPEGDFTLYFGTNERTIGVNLLSYQPAGEDGYFLLLAAPSVETTTDAIVHRDIIMVIDVSGSMQGEKLTQALDAAHYVVGQLNPDDRFNLIAFSSGVRLWQPHLQEVNLSTQRTAHAWIDGLLATGGTDINRALLEALAQLDGQDDSAQTAARPAYVLFLTDGLPTQGERESERIIANAFNNLPTAQRLRLFNFGVGYDVNTTLLDTLSNELGGRSSYVRPDERIDEEVSHFYHGISTPVLSAVTVEIAGQTTAVGGALVVDELYPFPLPDLFAGEQLVVVGRYHAPQDVNLNQALPVDITLRGKVNDETIIYHYPGQHFVNVGGEPNVARLWASRKIGAMLQEIRRYGPNPELIEGIVALSLQYGIITPYTSAFVPEPATTTVGAPGTRGQEGLEDEQLLAAPTAFSNDLATVDAAAASKRVQQAVGATAVAMSEAIGDLETADVVQNQAAAKYVAGRTFIPTNVTKIVLNHPLTRWIDTRYNEDMAVQTVLFGSACYFTLLEKPELAPWLAIAPELIITLDEQHALLITTESEAAPAQVCPTIDGIDP
jgi:Ca-activated chloride channel family protein